MARSKQTALSSKATKSVTRDVLRAKALQKPRKTTVAKPTVAKSSEGEAPKEKKKRKHSRQFLFVRRTRLQQNSVAPVINYAASIRIVKWAVDNTNSEAGMTNQLRFKPSAIRALHQAAQHVTHQILTDAYRATISSKMRELQPKHLENAIEVWSQYNDPSLQTQVRDLVRAYNEDK